MLGEEWKKFLGVIFNPVIILLFLLVVFLTWVLNSSPSVSQDEPFQLLLIAAISVFSGIIGNRVFAKMQKYEGEIKLSTRGQSAIRGLAIILSAVTNFNNRIRAVAKNLDTDAQNIPLIKRNYEEFVDKCISLQEQTINAIEEWKDIVPGADISQLHQKVSRLERGKIEAEEKVQALHSQLQDAKGDAQKTRVDLVEAMKKLDEVKSELEEQRFSSPIYRIPSLSGTPLYLDTGRSVLSDLIKIDRGLHIKSKPTIFMDSSPNDDFEIQAETIDGNDENEKKP